MDRRQTRVTVTLIAGLLGSVWGTLYDCVGYFASPET